ncbi:MAG TPA: hypothetical protein VFJ85_13260 [Acidimicrobiales bacterium]|nr:hypothetical protein [Acidimicrobiales bacterium]
MEVAPEGLRSFFEAVLPVLDERQRRLVAGATARLLGQSGVASVANATGMSRNTISGGLAEVANGRHRSLPAGRVRAPGAGRKSVVDLQPGLLPALEALIEPYGAAGVSSPFRWTEKSTSRLADELAEAGFHLSPDTVGRALKAAGYRLQPALRGSEAGTGPTHRQFHHIAEEAAFRLQAGEPVVIVDMTKKEATVAARDCASGGASPTLAATASSAIYALSGADGWTRVGEDDVAAALAVRAVRRWWETMGAERHAGATRIMIVPSSPFSAGTRPWGIELNRLALETGMELTVCRCPAGTVWWPHIEQRLFSFVTDTRPDRTPATYRAIVELCGSQGGSVKERAELDEERPPRRVAAVASPSDEMFLERARNQWNYTVSVRPSATEHASSAAAGMQV